jgi:hypothetical protein
VLCSGDLGSVKQKYFRFRQIFRLTRFPKIGIGDLPERVTLSHPSHAIVVAREATQFAGEFGRGLIGAKRWPRDTSPQPARQSDFT